MVSVRYIDKHCVVLRAVVEKILSGARRSTHCFWAPILEDVNLFCGLMALCSVRERRFSYEGNDITSPQIMFVSSNYQSPEASGSLSGTKPKS